MIYISKFTKIISGYFFVFLICYSCCHVHLFRVFYKGLGTVGYIDISLKKVTIHQFFLLIAVV